VADLTAIAALGSDTGGSIRQPASHCGVVGLKPTYGAVSRSGLIAAVSSFDQAGPITKTVEDAELIFNTIRGKDILDATSIDEDLYLKRNKGIPFNMEQKIKLAAEGMCGVDWAREFMAFLGEIGNINLPKLKEDTKTGQFMKTKDGQSTPYSKAAIGGASFKMANYIKDAIKIIRRDVKFPPANTQEEGKIYANFVEKDLLPNLEKISPAAFELLDGVMQVIHAFQGEELSIFLSDIKRKISMEDIDLLLNFLAEGHYNDKGSKYWNEVGKPKMREIFKYTKPAQV
jgi:hypothetical protein